MHIRLGDVLLSNNDNISTINRVAECDYVKVKENGFFKVFECTEAIQGKSVNQLQLHCFDMKYDCCAIPKFNTIFGM